MVFLLLLLVLLLLFLLLLLLSLFNDYIIQLLYYDQDTGPLLLVAGGFNDAASNGMTHDVELISSTPNNKCLKRVAPFSGNMYEQTVYTNPFFHKKKTC